MTGAELALAAQGLIGALFRLHGRSPNSGIDCIGLLAVSLERIGRPLSLPTGYPLRLRTLSVWLPDPQACGFVPAQEPFEPGDVILLRPGPAQTHLAIADALGGWVHAHAGLRRVVGQSERPTGIIIHHWRLTPAS